MVKICEVVDGCEDCPKYGDDCDGRGDAEMLNEDFRPKYMQQSRHDDGKDLISRADAIDACCRGWNNTIEDCIRNIKEIPSAWYKGMECAQDIISALPSAEAEWIPCSDRLPKAEDMYQPPEQRYLCQLEAHGVRKFCVLSRLKGAVSPFWDWYGVAVHDSEVTAWMPLPKPYCGARMKGGAE